MLRTSSASRSPWRWVPTLYFAEGIPNVIVMTITVIMYKRIGLDNASIAMYTAWLYLPWVIKPFWSPVVEMFKTKRWWITTMQLFIGAAMASIAFTLPTTYALQWTLAFFWLMAFSSATHDIAADGYYMLALDTKQQAFFVGIRSTFYRIATIAGQGLMIMFAGVVEVYTRQPVRAWSVTFWAAALVFLLLCLYHRSQLPRPRSDASSRQGSPWTTIRTTIVTYFQKPRLLPALAFMLLYRFPEALLTKISPLFLLDPAGKGGLGLTTLEIGIVQGTIGVFGLTLGGILGGIVVAQGSWRRWHWPMVWSISLPNAVYIVLAYYQPESLGVIASCIFVEQFGYGFGFTTYMLYLMSFSQGGPYQTAHYAFCTGFMALGLVLPGMFAGWLQEGMGYLNFFILVMLLVPVTFLVSALIRIPKDDRLTIRKVE